jgi:hypothetical protein
MTDKQDDLKQFLLREYGLLPEFIDGLTSLVEESEDYTCLTLKMMLGKRDKSYGSIAFAPPSTSAAARDGNGESCSESKKGGLDG